MTPADPQTLTHVAGWGGHRGSSVRLLRPGGVQALLDAVASYRTTGGGAIPRGMGRSYGDAAQLGGGLVVQLSALREFELDEHKAVLTAQAGCTVGQLLAALVPRGWMLPVVPGTQHVSIGGAIASDIHGKNHGAAGTFGQHVDGLALLTSAGELRELAPGLQDGLFEATVGGMGLTGIIVSARIRLRPVSGPLMSVDTDRVPDLDGAFAALSAPGGSYRVAWLDLLSPRWGRGMVTRAEHLDSRTALAGPGSPTVRARATIPEGLPAWGLRPSTVMAFNEFRFRSSPRRQRERPQGLGGHLFPLDALDAWPRLYGRGGLLQYQFVVPFGAEDVIRRVIEELRQARLPCYLAVLKDFGPAAPAPLSFPIPGWTLAVDIPARAPGLERALDRCDEWVAGCGGRGYLSKDVRMRADALRAMYPRLDEWREIREWADPGRLWRSDLALRTGLVSGEGA